MNPNDDPDIEYNDLKFDLQTLAQMISDSGKEVDADQIERQLFGEMDDEGYYSEWQVPAMTALYWSLRCVQDTELLNELTRDVTLRFIADILEKLKEGCFNATIEAIQGSGKSTIEYAILVFVCKTLLDYKRDIERRDGIYYVKDADGKFTVQLPILTWNLPETLNNYNKGTTCSFIIQDENNNPSGLGRDNDEADLSTLMKSSRFKQISTMVSSPARSKIAGCNWKLSPFGKWAPGLKKYRDSNYQDASECKSRALVWMKIDSSDVGNAQYKLMGYIVLYTDRAMEYMLKSGYYEAKDKNWDSLKNNEGSIAGVTSTDKQRSTEIAKQIINAAREEEWDGKGGKSELSCIAQRAEIDIPPKILKLTLSTAIQIANKGGEFSKRPSREEVREEGEEPEEEKSGEPGRKKKIQVFHVMGEPFYRYCYNELRSKSENQAKSIWYWLQCVNQEIVAEYNIIDKATTNGHIRHFREGPMGDLFQDWYALQISGISRHGDGVVDITGPEGKIYSCKCRRAKASKVPTTLGFTHNDMAPEYQAAKEQGKPYYLVCYEVMWGVTENNLPIIQVLEINPHDELDEWGQPQQFKVHAPAKIRMPTVEMLPP
jgi:hypothetical protein